MSALQKVVLDTLSLETLLLFQHSLLHQKLYSPEQVQSFKKLADACHENGAKLGIQLFHPDYNVKALNDMFHQGKMQEARAKLHHDMQHFVNEVTAEELDEIIKHMENCAILAHESWC